MLAVCALSLAACAEVSVPDARNVKIPSPVTAEERQQAVNERPDSVMYLPLGADVLVPTRIAGDKLPSEVVGPFELRSETLAGALQLILADYDVSIAFETEKGLTNKVTVANLKGPLYQVVNRVCSLADLYCSYEEETLVVKDMQTFAVTLPPLADADGGGNFIGDVIQGLSAVLGGNGTTPVSDPTTRTIIYSATQRTSKLAENYFQRLRANTAMIVFETYIWEVSLNAGNSAGVDWDQIRSFGDFNTSIDFSGSVAADFTNPVSIGLPTTKALGANPAKLLEFLSQFGAVKTISQPQITVLSGSEAELRVADTQNYVSEVSSTISGDNTTTSVSTDSVDSGFTLTIGSSWDKSTVYSNVNINLTNVVTIDDFAFDTDDGGGQTTIQLPQTTERELATQIRVRPGDSVLIAGLVREVDNFSSRGPGFMQPVLPDSRTAKTENLELVILLRPRVIVYTSPEDGNYEAYVKEDGPELVSAKAREEWLKTKVREPSSPRRRGMGMRDTPAKEVLVESPRIATKPIAPTKRIEPKPIVVNEPEVITPPVAVVEPEEEPLEAVPINVESAPSVLSSSYVSKAPETSSVGVRSNDYMRSSGTISRSDRTLSRVISETKTNEMTNDLEDDFYATMPVENETVDDLPVPAPSNEDLSTPSNIYEAYESSLSDDSEELTPSVDLYGDYRPDSIKSSDKHDNSTREDSAF